MSSTSTTSDATWPGRFAGKVAVVTGAAQGIGRDVAQRLGREGASVVWVDRSELVREVAGTELAVTADLEEYAGAEAAMAEARRQYGRIDILINNVGGTIWAKPYQHYQPSQIEAEIRRSLFPTLWCCHAALPLLLEHGGCIVNVSSVATRGLHRVPYAAAKGGVNALTASLAWEYAEHGIRVNAVAPGGTDAPPRRIPRNAEPAASKQDPGWYQTIVEQSVASSFMKRYGTVQEQSAAILFLASDEASYITGVTLPVAGGDLG